MAPKPSRRSRNLPCVCLSLLIPALLLAVLLSGTQSDMFLKWQQIQLHTLGSHAWPDLPELPRHSSICSNTCHKARDGVCDEGRSAASDPGTSLLVQCDLGTDCDDCGPWTGHPLPAPSLWQSSASSAAGSGQPGAGPVAWLTANNETLRVKTTTTQPPFLMTITEAERDPDTSAMIHHYSHMEGGITRAVHSVLADSCVDATLPGGRALVLVVGAGQGYFTLYAAAMGCKVVAWEPMPLFRAYLAHGIALNNFTHLVQVRSAAVSDLPAGSHVTLGVPKHGTYWGLASVNNLNLHKHEERSRVTAVTERLDDVVPRSQPVLMLKVDVEGYEPEVLASAQDMIQRRQCRHVFTEYSPGIAERHRDWQRLGRLSEGLRQLLTAGYRIGHMPTFAVAAPWPPKDMKEWYQQPFPELEEVGLPEVDADIQAAEYKQRTEASPGQCSVPDRLKQFPVWRGCHEWTRTVHPKGFRSSHGYNTNLWASLDHHVFEGEPAAGDQEVRQEGVLALRGHAALFARHEPVSGPNATWSSRARVDRGIGLLACGSIGAGHKLLHRCPCEDPAACGAEAAALLELTRTEGVFYKT